MGRRCRRLGPGVLLSVAWSAAAAGVLHGQAVPAWSVRLETGAVELHRATSTGWIVGATLGREAAGAHLRLDLAVAAGTADERFLSAHTGLEYRLLPSSSLTPIAAARVGLLAEPEYAGWLADVAAGLLYRASRQLALRGALSRGVHGGEGGPHSLVLGLEVAFGDR